MTEEFTSTIQNRKPQILVVDDEVAMVRSLELLLRGLGEIRKAYSVPEAEEYFERGLRFDCIVTDVTMPEASGLELLENVRKRSPEIPVIVMTAYSSVPQAVEAMHRGAFEYVVKPFENTDMLETVRRAISAKGFSLGETKRMPKGWVCNSNAMKEFLGRAERVAKTDSPLLILGEMGVGKRRIAQWIHDQSDHSKKEFAVVDARSHEEDSPLFQPKYLQKAGTLFVAEVFSASKRVQDRLAEILREGKIRLLTSTTSAAEIQMPENFREDLISAIKAVTLVMPSLAQRSEDVEALVREMLQQIAQKMKLEKLEISSGALQLLKNHNYLRNVVELEQILERAALEAEVGVISEAAIRFEEPDFKKLLPFSVPVEDGWRRLELLNETLEKELILRALSKYPHSSNTQIAHILGTTRRILELRMKAYRIRESS